MTRPSRPNSPQAHLRGAVLFLLLVALLEATLLLLPIPLSTATFMLVPIAAALLSMLLTGEALRKEAWRSIGLHRFQTRWFLIGLIVPLLLIAGSYAWVWGAGWGAFRIPAEYEGQVPALVIRFLVILIFGTVTTVLGEEFGWRGYLLPKLQSLGQGSALVWSSVAWGLFHVPIMLFTTLYHNDVHLGLYIPLFLLNIVVAGLFIGYLRIASRSLWPALIAHNMHNLAWSYGNMLTAHQKPFVSYLTGDAGWLLIVGYAIAFLIVAGGKWRSSPRAGRLGAQHPQ